LKRKRNNLEDALSYAFLLLKFRLRSENELQQRLKRKKFDPQDVKAVLAFLKKKEFVNDQLFARSWIKSRLKRPIGIRRLRQELKAKGVDQDLIQAEVEAALEDYSESEVVGKLAAEKLKKLKGIDRHKARQRIYRYLLYRGFSTDTISEALR